MGVIEKAVQWAIDTANNQSHGYSQANRWGPDYDCSSFVIEAYEQAGLSLREAGASYTGNMRGAMISCGFVDVTYEIGLSSGYGIQPGDVLLNYSAHTCLAVGGGQVANCRTDEGHPQTGDQSGNEIRIQAYWNFPWNCVLRYKSGGNSSTAETGTGEARPEPQTRNVLKMGMAGEDVRELQTMLQDAGYYIGQAGADGIYGSDTFRAVCEFQEDHGLTIDGVAGRMTIEALSSSDQFKVKPDPQTGPTLPALSAEEKKTVAAFLRALADNLERR